MNTWTSSWHVGRRGVSFYVTRYTCPLPEPSKDPKHEHAARNGRRLYFRSREAAQRLADQLNGAAK